MTNSGRIELKGVGISSGVAIGHVRLFHVSPLNVGESTVIEKNIDTEVERFRDAVAKTRQQIEELGKRVGERGEDEALTEVLTMHLLLLEDKMIYDRTITLIRNERYGAEYALSCVLKEVAERYAGLPDLFRERFKDVEDICRRIMDNLRGVHTQSLEHLEEESIIVAKDLAPSDTASMRRDKVLGFATEVGGKTSHTAILARALEIPAVVGVRGISNLVSENDLAIIDSEAGFVIIHPTSDDLREYREKQDLYNVRQSRLFEQSVFEPITLDGHVIELMANIEFASEVDTVTKYGAHGVGLYRTEYLFLNRRIAPSEDEQYEDYLKVAEKLAPEPVIIRTFDLGGDKFVHPLDAVTELNPFLGCRAIRFCLENQPLFRTQLRAILRAGKSKNIQILYPLISGCSELKAANDLLESLKDDLAREGVEFNRDISVGAMIEVPSAVIQARDLASDLDFFSIGTNDLIQYTLAVDRGNEKIAHLYQPLHPAVLRMIHSIVEVGRDYGIPVDVCGEMAGDPVCAVVLMSLGIERLSMAPHVIPTIRNIIRSVHIDQLTQFGSELLRMTTVENAKQFVVEQLSRLVPDHEDLSKGFNEFPVSAGK
ncbi:MAG: phosphoenolpyruvate--protein phosphotransferase [Candidatus Omnitrophota bacterium]|jgi:phosphotransferase system enzyme I (PtsI)|nr:MAG: phosphoenolpyruvate--protein phosphotransferase [Candidatus Omnitrophota bacterium]